MLVTDQGKLIRTPVETIRTTGRSAQGVTVFKVDADEQVVSVAWLVQEDEDEDEREESQAASGTNTVEDETQAE